MQADRFACSFMATDVVHIPGSAHGRQTADLCVMVWALDAVGTKRRSVDCSVTIDEVNADVLITFVQPTTGRVVIV